MLKSEQTLCCIQISKAVKMLQFQKGKLNEDLITWLVTRSNGLGSIFCCAKLCQPHSNPPRTFNMFTENYHIWLSGIFWDPTQFNSMLSMNENAWALMHLPRPVLYSSFAPKVLCHDWVRRSNSSVVRVPTDRHTHTQAERQTDRTNSITSTADAGGKDNSVSWLVYSTQFT